MSGGPGDDGRGADRRRAPRVAAGTSLAVHLSTAQDAQAAPPATTAVAVDVSAWGLRVHADEPLLIGAVVALELDPGDGDAAFKLAARVQWVMNLPDGQFEAGLTLDGSSGPDLKRWMAWIGDDDGSSHGPG